MRGPAGTAGEAGPKAGRLRGGETFSRVFEEGASEVGRFMVLHHRRRESGGLRAGVAAGKKLGSAVLRNRMRRRLREVLRSLPVGDIPADVVLVARRRTGSARFSELREEALSLFRQSGLLRDAGEGFDASAVEDVRGVKGSDSECNGSSFSSYDSISRTSHC
ncbi:MAG: ribonuclease P protein component [Bacillota bacterium]